MVVLIGDRFETFSAAVSAFVANIPIIHIGGGDLTRGAMDDAFRHSITKMSCLHFVSTKEHRRRVMQLGEDPSTVFAVGAPCIDNIRRIKLLTKSELERGLSIQLGAKSIIVTFHPVTLEKDTSGRQFKEVLKALDRFGDLFIIFTKPNADTNSGAIIKLMDEYVRHNTGRAVAFKSLGQLYYLSLLRYVDAVVGNSSSGIAEVPLFGKPTINIGDRQEGRIKASSIIDCEAETASIYRAMNKAFNKTFRRACLYQPSLYGKGNASVRIVKIIKKRMRGRINIKKSFYDL
jgi:GDP/UDP-N,N'-diacetylbacillosamine 2-epimerase (hydrolysing)